MPLDPYLSQLRILLVDDEPFQRRILRAVLRNLGFSRIAEAESCPAAISQLEIELTSIVLSDVDMPESNGLELLRKIRTGQTPARGDIGFIILTSHSNTEILSTAMALSVNSLIVKPFTTRVILDKITRIMNERMILRSESEYASVVTDIASLRRARFLANYDPTGPVKVATSGDGLQGRIEIPLSELRVGMRVAKSLTALDDTVILAAETTLTESLINLLSDLKELIAGQVVTVYDPGLNVQQRR